MLAFMAVGVVTILAVLLIVAALVWYLVSVILELQRITNGLDEVIAHVGEIVQKSAPVNDVVDGHQRATRRGRRPARGPAREEGRPDGRCRPGRGPVRGAAAAGFRSFPESTTVKAPRIGEVYTQGTLTLARLGREAPIAAGNPRRPALSNVERGSLAARLLYPEVRQTGPESLPRSPVIGTDAPVQYEQREDIGAPRKRLPDRDRLETRGARCRPPRHSSTSARPAWRARSRRCRGSAPRRASSPAGTACCR